MLNHDDQPRRIHARRFDYYRTRVVICPACGASISGGAQCCCPDDEAALQRDFMRRWGNEIGQPYRRRTVRESE